MEHRENTRGESETELLDFHTKQACNNEVPELVNEDDQGEDGDKDQQRKY